MATKELIDVDHIVLLRGHKPLKSLYELDNDVINYMKILVDLPLPRSDFSNITSITKAQMVSEAKSFCDSLLRFSNVGFLNEKAKEELSKGKEFDSVDDIVEYLRLSTDMISPYDLPLDCVSNKLYDGFLYAQLALPNDSEYFEELLTKMDVFFSNITLSRSITDITTPCYIHELMHSQTEKNKGIIADYYNSEVLSIFMELLYAYERTPGNYPTIIALRVNNMLQCFLDMYKYITKSGETEPDYGRNDLADDGKYVISIMKAFNLFDKYTKGSYGVKKDILTRMQRVIDGQRRLEEMLNGLDITYDSSMDYKITERLILK